MALVKICGLQSPEMTEQVAELGADYIGFVFARSRRQVSAAAAGGMIRHLRSLQLSPEALPKTVGVFVNPTLEELEGLLGEAELDIVQLHGQETPDFCRQVRELRAGLQVFKVFTLAGGAGEAASDPAGGPTVLLEQFERYRPHVDGFLLDTFDPVYGGGSGKTFAWEAIPPYRDWCREAGLPLLIAGGLMPDNVRDLLGSFSPDGVDVSSGVETEGVKDIVKIRSFVERVKGNV